MRSEIFKDAWAYSKKGLFDTFSECLKRAWMKYRIIQEMKTGMKEFWYVKKSTNTTRQALGTLKEDLIDYEFKGSEREVRDVITYWDMMRGAFRSFRIENYICVEVSNREAITSP